MDKRLEHDLVLKPLQNIPDSYSFHVFKPRTLHCFWLPSPVLSVSVFGQPGYSVFWPRKTADLDLDLQDTEELQPRKGAPPMWVSEPGMIKFAKELQHRKALSPMWVTESEMVKFVKELQLLKA